MDTLSKIGTILKGDEGRDAVHIAVYPAIAGQNLYPSDKVFLRDGKAYHYAAGELGEVAVGIVDPFLTKVVLPGNRFYVFLFPQSITSLRHVWTHPDIDSETP